MTDEERHRLLYALHHAAVDGQKTTLARIHYSWLASAAEEIERLAKELANANRLLEINRRRSLEKSGGLEIKQSDAEPVVWRYRWRVNAGVEWTKWREVNEIGAKYYAGLPDHEVQPLYTVPPRSH